MKTILKKLYSKKEYFIIILIIFLLTNFIYAVKGLYPYGKMTIINGDMGQAYVPFYYYLHDLLHGKADFMMNYNIGYGQDMYDITAIYGFLSPISWFVALTSRDNIPNFMNILFMIRLCLLGLSSFWVFKRLFKNCDVFYLYVFSVLYAFSGYVLGYYTNFVWLDNVILFPLLFYFLIELLNGKKGILYMIILALSWSLSFYISFMESLFVLFFSFLYLYFYVEKQNRKKVILNLVVHTIFALLISMMFWFPVVMQVLYSARISFDILTNSITKFGTKAITLIFYSLPFLGCILYFISNKIVRKEKLFSLLLLLFICAGVFLEPINIMWHTGSYIEFPLRYGFIIIWVIYYISLHYFEKSNPIEMNEKKVFYLVIVIMLIFLYFFAMRYIPKINDADPALGIKNNKLIFFYYRFFVISMIICFFTLIIRNKKVKKIFIIILVFVELYAHSFSYLGISSDKLVRSHSDSALFLSNDVYALLKKDNNRIKRYRDLDNNLYENSPLITSKSFLTTWHLTGNYLKRNHSILGYGIGGAKLFDSGGTIFSDQILGVNKVISTKEKDNDYYKFVTEYKKLKLYKYVSNLDYGIVYPKKNYKELNLSKNPFVAQNIMYKYLFDKDKDIIHQLPFNAVDNEFVEEKNGIYNIKKSTSIKFQFHMNEKSNLYFYSSMVNKYISGIIVNDEIVYLPVIDSSRNTQYIMQPEDQYGIVDLGIYDGDVEIQLLVNKGTKFINPSFAYISLSEWIENTKEHINKVKISKKNDKLFIDTTSLKNKALFLPINYSDGYSCTVNGKKVKSKNAFNNFMSIDLAEGKNNIVLSYTTPFLKLSTIYSIFSLLFYIIGSIILKAKKNMQINLLNNIIYILYHVVFITMFIVIYVYAFFR